MPDSKHLTLFKTQHQIEGEQIIATSEGHVGTALTTGEVILTSHRLCFCKDSRKPQFTPIQIEQITNITPVNMVISKGLTVETGTDSYDFQIKDKKVYSTVIEHLEEQGINKKSFWDIGSPEIDKSESNTKQPESKHVAKFKENHLESSDQVVTFVNGYIGEMIGKGDVGSLIVTSKLVAFYRKGLLGEVLETIPLKSITSIERRSTLGHCTIRIHTSHDDLTFKTMDKEQEAIVVKAIEDGRSIEPVSQTAPAPQNGLDTLRELNELKEQGIITEEEFNAKKQTILAAI